MKLPLKLNPVIGHLEKNRIRIRSVITFFKGFGSLHTYVQLYKHPNKPNLILYASNLI
jgi:hypothetical protein